MAGLLGAVQCRLAHAAPCPVAVPRRRAPPPCPAAVPRRRVPPRSRRAHRHAPAAHTVPRRAAPRRACVRACWLQAVCCCCCYLPCMLAVEGPTTCRSLLYRHALASCTAWSFEDREWKSEIPDISQMLSRMNLVMIQSEQNIALYLT